jgi:hypothetical protein
VTRSVNRRMGHDHYGANHLLFILFALLKFRLLPSFEFRPLFFFWLFLPILLLLRAPTPRVPPTYCPTTAGNARVCNSILRSHMGLSAAARSGSSVSSCLCIEGATLGGKSHPVARIVPWTKGWGIHRTAARVPRSSGRSCTCGFDRRCMSALKMKE